MPKTLSFLADRAPVKSWDDLQPLVKNTKFWQWDGALRGFYIGYHGRDARMAFVSSADLNAIDRRLRPALQRLKNADIRGELLQRTWDHWHVWPHHQPQRYRNVTATGGLHIDAIEEIRTLDDDHLRCLVLVSQFTGNIVNARSLPMLMTLPVDWLESLYPGCMPTIQQALNLELEPADIATLLDAVPVVTQDVLPDLPSFDC